jgi:DNA topoisomerase-3
MGEMVYEVVDVSISHLLNPELTASWEKGLTYVSEGTITKEEYMEKLEGFVTRRTVAVINNNKQYELKNKFDNISIYYKKVKSK